MIKRIKIFLKLFIRPQTRFKIRRIMQKMLGIENEWNGMKNTAIFDKIYEEGVWGKDVNGVSTSGAATRLLIGSGVVLHKAPFNLDVRNITNLLEVNSEGGKIQTILYEL